MGNTRHVDVLVVGGGPAGLLAAEAVASAGRSVLLVEKEHEIGCPVHTSGATSILAMRRFGIPERYYHPITRLRICSPNDTATFDFEEPIGCIIDVRGMYRHLAERANASGVSILTGSRADEALCDDNFVIGCKVTREPSGEFDVLSKIVIDASGYQADVSRQVGLHRGFTRFGVGAEYELLAPNCRQDEAVMVVGNRYAPSGYAWAFPWGETRVRVGVGILHADVRDNPKDHLATFIDDSRAFNVDLRESKVTEYHYGLVPADGVASQLVGNGVMAVGDAAGQASLVVGEGIRLSMLAGQLAGQSAVRAISMGRWDREALMPYERSFRSKFGRNLAIGHFANVRMAAWDDGKWDEQIRILKTVPASLFAKLLQSEFAIFDTARWIAVRPILWPRAIRFALRGLVSYFRSPRGKVEAGAS